MNFKRQKIKDYLLHDTRVENMFINEYMIDAPGDYVKVYLFALMYADIGVPLQNDIIAKQLSMADEDVLKAWSFWEDRHIIRKHYKNSQDKFHYQVEFLNLRELIYGGKKREKKSSVTDGKKLPKMMDDDALRSLYSEIERIVNRPFEGGEPAEILSWMEDYNVKPELVVYAYNFCVMHRKNSKYKYVGTILKEWADKGLKTIDDVEHYLEEMDNRHYLYKRVLKELGFLRNPTEEEKRIMNTWFDDMSFDIEKVLEACKKTSGISNPNINYVNSVLKAWNSGDVKKAPERSGGSVSQGTLINQVMKSYDEDRAKNEAKARERRNDVYQRVPRIRDIEEEVRSLGMEISKIMLSGRMDAKAKIRSMKKKVDELNGEKAFLLTENNFKIDYMDLTYTCKECKDTGILDTGERCSCFAEKLAHL